MTAAKIQELAGALNVILGAQQVFEEIVIAIDEVGEESYLLAGVNIGKSAVGGIFDVIQSYNKIAETFGLKQIDAGII